MPFPFMTKGVGGTGVRLVDMYISLVFFSFIFILLSFDQSMIMSAVSCSCEGERLLTLSDSVVSSTYFTDFIVSGWSMSLQQMRAGRDRLPEALQPAWKASRTHLGQASTSVVCLIGKRVTSGVVSHEF